MATLIGAPAAQTVTAALADRAAAAVDASQVYFLADGIACDIVLPDREGRDGPATRAELRAALAHAPVDIVVQEQDRRRKAVLVADMDSTVIREECIDELADEAGFGDRVARLTAAAMRGELDFEAAMHERVALLKGLPLATISHVLSSRIHPAAGAETLLATMRANGARCVLVSGGFTAFTGPIAALLGFHEHHANVLLDDGERLTGHVREPVLGASAKAERLKLVCREAGVEPADALAIGDGANDLDMIALAGSGVAVHGKPLVAERARHRIDHADLTALLYMQGYRASDFREPSAPSAA